MLDLSNASGILRLLRTFMLTIKTIFLPSLAPANRRKVDLQRGEFINVEHWLAELSL